MPVELGVCFSDHTWKRPIVYVPVDTRPCNLDRVARAKFLALYDGILLVERTWVQCYGEELRADLKAREAA